MIEQYIERHQKNNSESDMDKNVYAKIQRSIF